jgi:hypothetical protein
VAGSAAQGCGTVMQSAELQKGPADIVWIIDGSASMVDELATISDNISSFANSIGNAGIDHHVIMFAAASRPVARAC